MCLSSSNDKQHNTCIAQSPTSLLWITEVEPEHVPISVPRHKPRCVSSAACVTFVRRTTTTPHKTFSYKGLRRPVSALLSIHALILASMLLSSVPCLIAAPVELLQNGNFKKGLDGWTVQGVVFLEGEIVKITREGSLSQIVRRPDLSFYLELSYNLRTELPSQVYFVRSLVTFDVIDRTGKASSFTVIGERRGDLGDSGWRETRLGLSQLFKKEIGDLVNFQLLALKIAVELGFTAPVPTPATASLRSISLRRVNPARILLNENARKQLGDRTELVVSATNVGDMNASNIVAALVLPPEVIVISENVAFVRSILEGGASWQLNWMVAAKASGTYPVTVKVNSDQGGTELSLSIPIPGMPQLTTTQITTTTLQRTSNQADQTIVVFLMTAFLVFVAFLILAIVLPLVQNRGGTEVVYRLRLIRKYVP